MTKLTYIFILLKSLCFGQTMLNDTIDYSVLVFDKYYVLEKISQKNGSSYYVSGDKKMIITKVKDLSPILDMHGGYCGLCKLNPKINDTTIYMDWDVESKKLNDAPCHHCVGKMTIDQGNNVLNIKKCRVDAKKTPIPIYIDRKYKIITLTKTTLIIKDISNLDFLYKFKLE